LHDALPIFSHGAAMPTTTAARVDCLNCELLRACLWTQATLRGTPRAATGDGPRVRTRKTVRRPGLEEQLREPRSTRLYNVQVRCVHPQRVRSRMLALLDTAEACGRGGTRDESRARSHDGTQRH